MIRYRDLSIDRFERKLHLKSINNIFKTGDIIDGYQIKELEKRIAEYYGRSYAIAVNSGTSAIFLALQALGIKSGDEVIVPCMGVVPVVNPILLLGAKPIFVDVKEDYNINPIGIKDKITDKAKAILAVNYTGKLCDFPSLVAISQIYGLRLIEDASQSFGMKNNSSSGDITVMSMNAMKVFGTAGEAGMILTDDSKMDEKLRQMRYNGLIDKVISNHISLNHRLNTIQATILLNKLDCIDEDIKLRKQIAKTYTSLLKDVCITPDEDSSFFTYNIRVKCRDELHDYLLLHGIETQKRDSILLPMQLSNRSEYKDLKFPVGE